METHRLASQLGRTVILGIGDVELLLRDRGYAAQVLREGFQRVLAADFQLQFLRFDRLAVHARDAFQSHHREIPVLHRTRVHVDVIRLLLPDFLDAGGNVCVRNLRVLVGHFDAFVVLQFNLRHHFERRLEA